MYKTLRIERQSQIATIWMDRPDVFNAFDEQLISDLHRACEELDQDATLRVVILGGVGKHFSAGADLNWMRRACAYSQQENLEDARKFANMLHALSTLSKPTIARVQGAALGGGTGLAAACDIAIACKDASFATSEVKFSIIPAVISPYVLRAMGPRHALRYFQNGERFSAQKAYEMGLITELCEPTELDTTVAMLAEQLLAGAPLAQKAAKELIDVISAQSITEAVREETAKRISLQRSTPEAKEGITAFLDKCAPPWIR